MRMIFCPEIDHQSGTRGGWRWCCWTLHHLENKLFFWDEFKRFIEFMEVRRREF